MITASRLTRRHLLKWTGAAGTVAVAGALLPNFGISAALGAPTAFVGKDLRKAHADMGLTDVHFNAIAEHLQSTLVELKVPKATIDRILAIVETTRDDVLNRSKKS